MHYQAPHPRGIGGFVVLPVRARPEPVRAPRKTGWLATLFSSARTAG